MKVVAIIQARMGSTRLPGKVLMNLGQKTVIGHIISRVKMASKIHDIIVATTDKEIDDPIVAEATKYEVHLSRGSELDVLGRFYNAARTLKPDYVVRLTADCPLLEPSILDQAVQYIVEMPGLDYITVEEEGGFPRGLDVEVFTFQALEEAYREGKKDFEREHVTPFIYRNPDRYSLYRMKADNDYSQYRFTLDTPEDFDLLTKIFDAVTSKDTVTWMDAIQILEQHSEWQDINRHVQQKELV